MDYYSSEVARLTQIVYPSPVVTRQIIATKQYIDQKYDQKLTLSGLASHALISKFHFIRLFKLHYGCTPHQYLTTVRIANAKKHLLANKPVNNACFAVGYESISTFTTLFKRQTGTTPALLRKRKKSNIQ